MKKINVLIVEDEALSRELIKEALKLSKVNCTIKIDEAESAEDALKKCIRKKYDLIFCDLVLPGMSGLDLIEALYQVEPDQCFIVVSAYVDHQKFRRIYKYNLLKILKKPVKVLEIINAFKLGCKEIFKKCGKPLKK